MEECKCCGFEYESLDFLDFNGDKLCKECYDSAKNYLAKRINYIKYIKGK